MTTKRRESEQERNREIDERVFSLTGKTEEEIIQGGTPLEKACLLLKNFNAYTNGKKANLTEEQREALYKNATPSQRKEYYFYLEVHDALQDYNRFVLRYEMKTAQYYLAHLYGALNMYDLLDKEERQGVKINNPNITKWNAWKIAKRNAKETEKCFSRVKAAAQYIVQEFIGKERNIAEMLIPDTGELRAAFDDKIEEYFFGVEKEKGELDSDSLYCFIPDDKYYKAKSRGEEAIIPDYDTTDRDDNSYNGAKAVFNKEVVRRYETLVTKTQQILEKWQTTRKRTQKRQRQ